MRVIVHVVFFVQHACWRIGYTVVYPQLQLIDKVFAPWFDELRGGFFRALHTGAGPGVVSTSPVQSERRTLLHQSRAAPGSPKVGSRMVRVDGGWWRRWRWR